MLRNKISNTIIFSFLTNQIFCDLLKEGNEDAKDEDKSKKPLYDQQAGSIYEQPLIQRLQPDFPLEQNSLKPPIILSLGFGDFSGYKDIVLPTNFPNPYRNPLKNNAILTQNLAQNLPVYDLPLQIQNYGGYRKDPPPYLPFQNFDSGGNLLFSWMKSLNQRFPMQYFVPPLPDLKFNGPSLSSPMKNPTLDLLNHSPHIEILKSLGYTLPSEMTTYHPRTFANFIDVPSPDNTKTENYNSQSLLLGEQQTHNVDEEQNEEQSVTNYRNNDPNKYYYANRRPIAFEPNSRNPKNIYEVISAEKILPKEIDMSVQRGRPHQRSTIRWIPTMSEGTDGNMAQGSDVISVKSVENVEEDQREENKSELNESEVMLTGEVVYENGEADEKNQPSNESDNKLKMLTGEEIKSGGVIEDASKNDIPKDEARIKGENTADR